MDLLTTILELIDAALAIAAFIMGLMAALSPLVWHELDADAQRRRPGCGTPYADWLAQCWEHWEYIFPLPFVRWFGWPKAVLMHRRAIRDAQPTTGDTNEDHP